MEKLTYRVDRLEKDMDTLCLDVKSIMENHLPHLQAELQALKSVVKIYGTIIVAAIVALIGVVVAQ
jgi:uncharacterized protein (UPF0335 family)